MENILQWLNGSQDYELGLLLLRDAEPRNRLLPVLLKGESAYTMGKLRQELRRIYHAGPAQKESRDQYLDRKIAEATAALVLIPDKEELMDELRGRELVPPPLPETVPVPVPVPQKPAPRRPEDEANAAKARAASRAMKRAGKLYPEEIEKAIQVRSKLANERDRLANTLADIETQEERARVRAEIQALNEEVQRYHQFVKEWERTKQVPKEKPWVEEDPQEKEVRSEPDEREKLRKKLFSARVSRTKKKKQYQKWMKDTEADPWMRKAKIDMYQGEYMKFDRICKELEEQLGLGAHR